MRYSIHEAVLDHRRRKLKDARGSNGGAGPSVRRCRERRWPLDAFHGEGS